MRDITHRQGVGFNDSPGTARQRPDTSTGDTATRPQPGSADGSSIQRDAEKIANDRRPEVEAAFQSLEAAFMNLITSSVRDVVSRVERIEHGIALQNARPGGR
jgi:hypothetical protein